MCRHPPVPRLQGNVKDWLRCQVSWAIIYLHSSFNLATEWPGRANGFLNLRRSHNMYLLFYICHYLEWPRLDISAKTAKCINTFNIFAFATETLHLKNHKKTIFLTSPALKNNINEVHEVSVWSFPLFDTKIREDFFRKIWAHRIVILWMEWNKFGLSINPGYSLA